MLEPIHIIILGLIIAVGGVAWQIWISTQAASVPEKLTVQPKTNEPIVWSPTLGIEYSTQQNGTVYMRAFLVNGINKAGREIALSDAYFVSGMTGEKLLLRAAAGPNDGFLRPSELNPIPPGAIITLRAEFNPPNGYTASEFLPTWRKIYFYSEYEGMKFQKVFDETEIEAKFDGFRPKQTGPKVTKKSAP